MDHATGQAGECEKLGTLDKTGKIKYFTKECLGQAGKEICTKTFDAIVTYIVVCCTTCFSKPYLAKIILI